MHSNRLSNEKSPYLLQHAHNPVDWYPWGPEAFDRARREDKPIFLSIGYSTCHWCHVMERESFENEAIAAVLNRLFVCIKVDREERPDIDRIYMAFVQSSTGSGGWPMSVWLTPDLRPFVGGTYFPPENRYGRAGFPLLCQRIAEAWQNDRPRILESARDVVKQLEEQSTTKQQGQTALSAAALDNCFEYARRSFDSTRGGFGQAPKFPRPTVLNFLFRYYAHSKNEEALEMATTTLQAMAMGGMNDQLGGGFHRYSVDANWFVPHFEKMLYDQAQLAISYLEAFQITHDRAYAETARSVFEYVLRDMTGPERAFYSAEDADSAPDPASPKEKSEGAFYIWSQGEIEAFTGDAAAAFCYHFGAGPDGNVNEDPHHEFTGRNILYQAHPFEDVAQYDLLREAAGKLFQARQSRPRPHLDDKILTAWNALMISAFAKGAGILAEPRYLTAAREAADFILNRLYDPATRILLRRFRDGEAAIPGFLDDYAFFVQALLDLYEACFDMRYLEHAIALTDAMIERFADAENGAFFSTPAGDAELVMRMKDDYDGAEPSGNSVAALNLMRLAQFTARRDFDDLADRTFAAFAPRLMSAGFGVPQMLVAYAWRLAAPKQIVLAAPSGAAGLTEMLREVHARYLPNRVLMLATPQLAALNPALAAMAPIAQTTAAYLCENYACRLPFTEPADLGAALQ